MPVTAELCSHPNEALLPEITIVPLFLLDARAWGQSTEEALNTDFTSYRKKKAIFILK